MEQRFYTTLQENLLTLLAHDNEHGKIVAGLIDPQLFEGDLRDIAIKCVDYWRREGRAPGPHTIDLFASIVEDPDNRRGQTYRRILTQMLHLSEHVNTQYVLRQLETFMRMQRIKDAILKSAEQLQAKQELAVADVEEIWNGILRTQAVSFDPGLRLYDIDRVLSSLQRNQSEFITGIPPLDKRGIVPERGTVTLWLGEAKIGKCIAEGQLVLLPSGKRKPIEQIVRDRDQAVLCLDEHSGRVVPGIITSWWENGTKDCIKLKTSSGRSIITTSNHLYLTQRGWIKVENLRPTVDYVAVPSYLPNLGGIKQDVRKIRLLAYLIADGSLFKVLTYTKKDAILRADFTNCVSAFGDAVTWKDDFIGYVVTDKYNKCKTNEWINSLGLRNKKSNAKFVPDFVFESDQETIRHFLCALLSSDGSIYKQTGGRPAIEFCSASPRLAEDVRHLLIRFGIFPRIKYFNPVFDGKVLPTYGKLHILGRENVQRFVDEIGFIGKKARTAEDIINSLIKMRPDRKPYKTRPLSDYFILDRVEAIELAGKKRTYDLTVAKYHNFIAEDMVAHNSWALIKSGKEALLMRKKVVHVSLEMSEELTGLRYYQSFWSVPKYDDKVRITSLMFNRKEEFDGFEEDWVQPKFSFASPNIILELQSHAQNLRLTDNLVIKRYPPRFLTIAGLEAFLDTLEQTSGFVPDLLILDYIGIVWSDPKNPRISIGRAFEDFRALCVRRNIAGITAQQINRIASGTKFPKAKNIAEDWTMVATADNIIIIARTELENRLGLARLYVDAARSEADKFGALITQAYPIGQFALDAIRLPPTYFKLLEEKKKDGSIEPMEDDSGEEETE